jgi:predicted double-glycine peptidase
MNDAAGIKSATPLVDAEESPKNTNARPALYRPRVAFQPAVYRQEALNAPDTPVSRDEFPGLAQNNVNRILASNPPASAGTATAVAPTVTPAAATLPDANNMPYYLQQGNACGTTTLAEIMTYLGKKMDQADVDKGIRRLDTFTAPEDMINFARQQGLEAEGYNNSSFDEIKAMIDAGHPVQAMVEGDSSVSVTNGTSNGKFSVDGLHYINITGYGTDPATGEEYVTYHDPNRLTEQRMSVSDFEKMWGNVNLEGFSGGFKNYFIAYGDQGADLPPGRDTGTEGAQGTLNGVVNFTNGIDRIFSPDSWGGFVHGLFEVGGSVPQALGSFSGAVLQISGSWINNQVNGIPVLQNIVKPVGDLMNGTGAVIGDLSNSVGEFTDDIGGAFEDLSHGDGGKFVDRLGDAATDIGSGVVNAVKDTADSVVDTVVDVFSGW